MSSDSEQVDGNRKDKNVLSVMVIVSGIVGYGIIISTLGWGPAAGLFTVHFTINLERKISEL